MGDHDDGDCFGCFLGCLDRVKNREDKHIDFESHEFGDDAWDSFELSLCAAVFNEEGFALGVTKLAHPLPQCLDIRPRIGRTESSRYVADARDFWRLLRLSHGPTDYEPKSEY